MVIAPKEPAKPAGQVGHQEGMLPEYPCLFRRNPFHDLVHGNGKSKIDDLIIAKDHHCMLHGYDLPAKPIEGGVHNLEHA